MKHEGFGTMAELSSNNNRKQDEEKKLFASIAKISFYTLTRSVLLEKRMSQELQPPPFIKKMKYIYK